MAMIKVFKANDTDFTSNGEIILKPNEAIITKNIEEEYIELECPLKYADFLIQDNVLIVDTLTGKKGYRILNPITSNVISIKAYLFYQEKIVPGADRGVVISHGKNLEGCKVTENWDDVVTRLIPVGYNDIRLPEGYLSVPSPYQKVYEKTIKFELSESLESQVEALEELIDTNTSIKESLENSITILTSRKNTYIGSVTNLQEKQLTLEARLEQLGASEPELQEKAIIEAQLEIIPEDIATYTQSISSTETAITTTHEEIEQATIDLEEAQASYNNIVINDLRSQAQAYLNTNKFPRINYDLEAHLNGILEIGDTVHVKHPDMRVDLITGVTAYKWNCLTGKFAQVVFGTLNPTLKGRIAEVEKKAEKAIEDSEKVNQRITKYSAEYKRDNRELVSKFMSEVYGVEDGVFGLLEKNQSLFRQTASSIKAQVSQVDNKLTTKVTTLELTANGISATVSANYNSLHQDITRVDVRADGILSIVQLIDGDLTTAKSTITQQANQISLRVEKNKVISEINQSSEGIKISANKIDITGLVTVSSLSTPGSVVIDAGNLKATGTISGLKFTNGAVTIDDSNIIVKATDGYLKAQYGSTTFPIIGFDGVNSIYVGSRTYYENSYLYMRQKYVTIGYSGSEVRISSDKISFFNATPTTRKTISKLSGTQFLSYAYDKINEILTELNSKGLISSS